MRPRARASQVKLASLIVLTALVAGCISATSPAAPPAASLALGGWSLDCTLGVNVWAQKCEAKATRTPGSKAETWVAVNPKDPNNVVVGAKDLNHEMSNKCVWTGYGVTHDGGKTWKDVTIGGKYADRAPLSPWFGYACNTDPMFAFDATGDLHALIEAYGLGYSPQAAVSAGVTITLATSHDGGDTWPDVLTFFTSDGNGLSPDHPWLVVSPKTQTILVAMIDYIGGERCYVFSSRDGGQSADAPVIIPVVGGRGCMFAAVAQDGTFAVGGLRDADPTATGVEPLWFATSKDDGKTFTDPKDGFTSTILPAQFKESQHRTGLGATLAFARDSKTLLVAYQDYAKGDADVLVRSSADGGATWSSPVAVGEDGSKHHQWNPNIAVARDGSLHVFYMDKRYDAANRLIDISHAVSLDGGKAWATQRVTTVSWDGDLGRHQDGYAFVGDYLGIDASGPDVWGAFPDASDGKAPEIAAARLHLAGP